MFAGGDELGLIFIKIPNCPYFGGHVLGIWSHFYPMQNFCDIFLEIMKLPFTLLLKPINTRKKIMRSHLYISLLTFSYVN